jgi:hypothetical protein
MFIRMTMRAFVANRCLPPKSHGPYLRRTFNESATLDLGSVKLAYGPWRRPGTDLEGCEGWPSHQPL